MMANLAETQIVLLLLAVGGAVLVKTGLLLKTSTNCLINIMLYLVMPCNILYSFLTDFDVDKIMNFFEVFLVAIFVQVVSLVFGRCLYNRISPDKKPVLQFATTNSNAMLLGAPFAESMYGSLGLSYASIYVIPSRMVMWSAGIAYFTKPPNKMMLVKSSLAHPCMIAVLLGFILVPLRISFPYPVMEAMRYFGACTMPLAMVVIGVTLAEVKFKDLADLSIVYFSIIRLGVLPLVAYGTCLLFHLNAEVTGIAVIMTAMPAGASTTIIAAKYGNNCSGFASKCVVFSTVASFISTLAWSVIVL